jgi:hypothetical protein
MQICLKSEYKPIYYFANRTVYLNRVEPVVTLHATCPTPRVVAHTAGHVRTPSIFFNLTAAIWALVYSNSLSSLKIPIFVFHVSIAASLPMAFLFAFVASERATALALDLVSFVSSQNTEDLAAVGSAAKNQVGVFGHHFVDGEFLVLFEDLVIKNGLDLLLRGQTVAVELRTPQFIVLHLVLN